MSEAAGTIERLTTESDLLHCAQLMATSEPWVTLGRTVESSRRTLLDPGKEVYVLKERDAVQGFVVIDLRGPFTGYLQSVCVRPELRDKGYGARLIAHAETRIFLDSPNVFICVSTFNPGARRLYERLGYVVVGELNDFLVRGHGEILMRKTRGPWSELAHT